MATGEPSHGGLWEGRRAVRLAWVALTMILTGACISVTAEEGDEVYLGGTSGPYRGRVVDATTKQPTRGVVVLAVWYYRVPGSVQWVRLYNDAIERLTSLHVLWGSL